MKHPIQPKYRINQKVTTPFCSLPLTIIKSIRYITESEWKDNRQKFVPQGWEYQIYYYSSSDKTWSEWGWLKELELDSLND